MFERDENGAVKAALKAVKEWHRHLPDLQGGLFAVKCVTPAGECVGVGIAGNPSRVWQGKAKLVISRVATTGYENACSAIYGALCRAAKALGYIEVWTYTLPEEPGTSLRAAGFMAMGLSDGGEYDRPSRARRATVRSEPKQRWLRRLGAGSMTLPALSPRDLTDSRVAFDRQPHEQAIDKYTIVNGEWVKRPFVFSRGPNGMTDRPANDQEIIRDH